MDLKHVFKQNHLSKIYTDENILHLSTPFWRKGLKQTPYYTDMSWNGSSIKNFTANQIMTNFKEFILETLNYNQVNFKINACWTVLPIPYPWHFSPMFNKDGNISYESQFVEWISTLTSTYQTADLGPSFRVHAELIKRMPIAQKMTLKNQGVYEDDEFVEIAEKLMNVYDAYESFNEEKEDEDFDESDY